MVRYTPQSSDGHKVLSWSKSVFEADVFESESSYERLIYASTGHQRGINWASSFTTTISHMPNATMTF
ncbi:hypothetical protein K493DRAFT_107369 [Basidiobolus meristosporus CBS 931.73]|uniref:Uncharacterized protein n=1 Tax=Basidiobolus meristosporus CBS 931.73 TaxID=1314790 RepID=A0A1Y1WU07_9FUNG|nr:hypothetical protein K493DRAFT_107369 [Basidiobolus meristosporus CBS 931.73]|eukprot:ORX77021.1 hypothetical protein K493DRAFT_107369 [Basidiobolus meristosporus CBS 931.73]